MKKTTIKGVMGQVARMQKHKQAYSAIIINKLGEEIHAQQQKNVQAGMNFKNKSTEKYTLRAILIFKASSKKKMNDQNVKLTTNKRNSYLALHEKGGTLKKGDQKAHFTAEARGGSYKKMPKKGKFKGGKLPAIKGSNHRARMGALRVASRNKNPFFMNRKNGKQGGVFQFINGELRQLRSFERDNIRVKPLRWNKNAIVKKTGGRAVGKVVRDEFKKQFIKE